VKNQDKVIINAEEDTLMYLVFFTGDELPIAMFWDMELAYQFCNLFTHSWMDKEIRSARMWNAVGPLFRDRTQFVARVSIKKLEDEGLT
jgi:hypothetical protein